MKIIILVATITLFTGVVEVTGDDQTELVYSLLAKVREIESKLKGDLGTRNTREIKKDHFDMPAKSFETVSYIRWGNSTCEYGANTIYSGYAGGGYYTQKGSPANLLCMPQDPQYYSPSSSGSQYIYGVEYQISGINDHAYQRNIPCALCQAVGRSAMIMIPSHYECPTGWHTEYNGYIMTKYHGYEGSSMYHCVDKNLEQVPGSGGDSHGHELHTVRAECGYYIPCSSIELTCVVCTM